MNQKPQTEPTRRAHDSDMHKGAIEEGEPQGQDNPNAPALDEEGMPNDPVAIAQDVIGANEDQTQG